LEREYDLRMLGLAGENGKPDTRGEALIEVLRANGAVSRPADDDAMLDLCGALSKLMEGIDGSPFDFASGSGEIAVRGHRFTWDGSTLVLRDREPGREFASGDFVMIGTDGRVRTGPVME
jgi:hypothetical protein